MVFKSQHFTVLSSEQENIYGCHFDISTHHTAEIWPVYVSFNAPEAKSQNFIVQSVDPVAKNSFDGSNETDLTQPVCPIRTLESYHY